MRSFRLPLFALLSAATVTGGSLPAQAGNRGQPASGTDSHTVMAVRLTEGIVVDGVLDEPAWNAAEVASGFVQRAPVPGAAASERTEARVLYDDRAVYVAMRMYDRDPAGPSAPLGRRDMPGVHSDWALVMLDSYRDGRTAFVFGVNPRGVKKDMLIYNDAEEDVTWDAVYDVATRVDSTGWTAEFRIPLSQLRFSPEGARWGINFQRRIARADEVSLWAPWLPQEPGYVSRFGVLSGLEKLQPPRRIEVQPYTRARLTRAPPQPGNPFYRSNRLDGTFGADFKYGLASNVTLTAALNPDFGQVEADPSQVNLTAFETLLDEKRPFFVEGGDIFRSGIGQIGAEGGERLFYTRRIGRTPQRPVSAAGVWSDAPSSTRIVGAAKMSGKTATGWTLGALTAVTAAERARIRSGAEMDTTWTVEPSTSYSVFRVSRDFHGGTRGLGAIVTSTVRDLADPGLEFLHSSAFGGGVDGRIRFGRNGYEASGFALGSRVAGTPRALLRTQQSPTHYFHRPDADHLGVDSARTSLAGTAAHVQVRKLGGHWRWMATGTMRSPGFHVNDLGYQYMADGVGGTGSVTYIQYRPGPTFQNWFANVNGGSMWTFGGERTLTPLVVQGGGQLKSFWSGSFTTAFFLPSLSPSALRGGPALAVPGRTLFMANLASDPRRSLGLRFNAAYQVEPETGGRLLNVGPTLTLRPSSHTDIALGASVIRNGNPWQFVPSTPVGEHRQYLFARLEQTTAALTARLNQGITPTMSLQLYSQPFVSAGEYQHLRAVASPRAGAFEARMPLVAADISALPPGTAPGQYAVDVDGDGHTDALMSKPDFNIREVRSNVVLRWEYRPASTLFLVWSHGQSGFDNDRPLDFARDIRALFGAPARQSLLVKLTYWFDL